MHLPDATRGAGPTRYQVGFQQMRRRWLGAPTLGACWVDVCVDPPSATLGASGTFGREQFAQIAAKAGAEFPFPELTLDDLRLEPADVLRIVEARPLGANLGALDLGLCKYEGLLAWRVLQEVPGTALRTLFMDAARGDILFEKTDRESNA